jgi:rhamnogalacturonyl hydrolase YesR
MIFLFSAGTNGNDRKNSRALQAAISITDRIIAETEFAFEPGLQEQQLDVQVIDFKKEFNVQPDCRYFALSYIHSELDTAVTIGISAAPEISVFLNDKAFDFIRTDNPVLKEVAYGMINFADTVQVKLRKGINKILIRYSPGNSSGKIFLRQILSDPESEGWIKFIQTPVDPAGAAGWLAAGPFPAGSETTPESVIKDAYKNGSSYIIWNTLKQNIIPRLKINPANIFKKDSYADWNYANGETILSILTVAEAAGNSKYNDFVKKWCDFILQNTDYFRWQYDSLHALRGSFHRIFRKSMLDDAGAPVLPFTELYLQEKNPGYREIVYEMADYIMNGQVRLPGGTLCRPEPVEMTVWADDLFMAVPVLLRMAKITGEKKYYDEAAEQAVHFYKLLYNSNKKLFKHGWFSKTGETSSTFWGRANGWIMWAVTEILMYLPGDHPAYKEIMSIYKNHIDGLISYQDSSGIWHQVIDYPESYEETSCTAMFILGIARGVNNGWLNDSYKKYALKGWEALSRKIEPGGIVHGICRGTGIGEDVEFYFNRPTLDNDPRGLGAVLTACVEISKLK